MGSVTSAPFELPPAPAPADLIAKYFRTLADPTRLRILDLLSTEGELTVGELAVRLGVSQPGISNHLACLRRCGFVGTRRSHRSVFNFIADARVTELLELGQSLLASNEAQVAACSYTEATL